MVTRTHVNVTLFVNCLSSPYSLRVNIGIVFKLGWGRFFQNTFRFISQVTLPWALYIHRLWYLSKVKIIGNVTGCCENNFQTLTPIVLGVTTLCNNVVDGYLLPKEICCLVDVNTGIRRK